jgi:hypothetical protein
MHAGIKLLWKPFKEQFGTTIGRIRYSVDLVEKEAVGAEMEQASEERAENRHFREVQATRWDRAALHHQKIDAFVDGISSEFFLPTQNGRSPVLMFITGEQRAKFFAILWGLTGDPEKSHNLAVSLHQRGTGTWFFQTAAYLSWWGKRNSFLWLYAIRRWSVIWP